MDPFCEIPAVRVFVGYLGDSSRKDDGEDWVRLYFTLDLTDFIDVKEEDIVYNERSTSGMLPRTGTILWVRSDAKIWHTRIRAQAVMAGDFLRGRIVDEDMADTEPSFGRPGESLAPTPSWIRSC